ncbi:Putative protein of unknown function [Podospora comata]|uniref:C2H2-type domain-containing protein n=1 Tax=Podospora comata TaxID=48703 RepID=A0ABY6SIH4_PODCO|nr:Putative protein of unknown function [Podospora comata]
MACDLLHLFDHEQACSGDSLVCALLRKQFHDLITGLQQQSLSGCPLEDIGNFLVNILHLASELARSVVKSQHLRDFTTDLAPFLAREPGLRSTKYLDGKHEALKKISGQVRELSKTAVGIWKSSPSIPSSLHGYLRQPIPTPTPTGLGPQSSLSQSTSLPFRDNTSTPLGSSFTDSSMATPYAAASWDSLCVESSTVQQESNMGGDEYDDNIEYAVVTSLEEINSRGRGVGPYICSHRENCNKGGVDSNGRMRVFKRNSDIKAHLEKHEKRFKCDLPGCPKPEKGFARADQLERHKQKVAHGLYRGR